MRQSASAGPANLISIWYTQAHFSARSIHDNVTPYKKLVHTAKFASRVPDAFLGFYQGVFVTGLRQCSGKMTDSMEGAVSLTTACPAVVNVRTTGRGGATLRTMCS